VIKLEMSVDRESREGFTFWTNAIYIERGVVQISGFTVGIATSLGWIVGPHYDSLSCAK